MSEPLSNKVTGLEPATLLKKRARQSRFPVNFATYLETTFLLYTSEVTASIGNTDVFEFFEIL